MKKQYLLILLSAFILFSCEKKFDLIAEWKDITVVYGLLNQQDAAHYIKISKSFLGDMDAAEMAQIVDSLYYGEELQAKLEEYSGNNLLSTYTLERDTTIPKPAGYFAYPFQVLYKTKASLNCNYTYKLYILNTETGKEVRAMTELIDSEGAKKLKITKPSLPYVTFAEKDPYLSYSSQKVEWYTAKDGRLYELCIRFHYSENDTQKYVDWLFSNRKSDDLEGGQIMQEDANGEEFYKFLSAKIPVVSNVTRIADSLDFIVTVAGEEFATYLEINAPSSSIVQYKPEYTNIENGVGLFSSRYTGRLTGKQLSSASMEELVQGQYTGDLGFVFPD